VEPLWQVRTDGEVLPVNSYSELADQLAAGGVIVGGFRHNKADADRQFASHIFDVELRGRCKAPRTKMSNESKGQ